MATFYYQFFFVFFFGSMKFSTLCHSFSHFWTGVILFGIAKHKENNFFVSNKYSLHIEMRFISFWNKLWSRFNGINIHLIPQNSFFCVGSTHTWIPLEKLNARCLGTNPMVQWCNGDEKKKWNYVTLIDLKNRIIYHQKYGKNMK